MPRGGARPGSGPKKGFEKERARQKLRELVWAKMDAMIAAQVDNAAGIKYLVVREKKTGKFVRVTESMAKVKLNTTTGQEEEVVEVCEKDPNVYAFADLMNRTIDKPTETVDANVAGRLEIRWLPE